MGDKMSDKLNIDEIDFYPTTYNKLGDVNEAQLRQIVRAVGRVEEHLCMWNAMHDNALRRVFCSNFYNKDGNLHMTLVIQEITDKGKKEVERKDYIIDGKTIWQKQDEEIARLVLDYKSKGYNIQAIQRLMRDVEKWNLAESKIAEIINEKV